MLSYTTMSMSVFPISGNSEGDVFSEEITRRLNEPFLHALCQRPSVGLTEVRRDGKDDEAVTKVIKKEFARSVKAMGGRVQNPEMAQTDLVNHMRTYAAACWATMESMHLLKLDEDKPENERIRLDPDHWYENNLSNASLFANLSLDGLEQVVPGRLFTTRMPRDIVEDIGERNDFLDKCKKNNLKVACVLTEPEEFKKYSGMDGLLDFYRKECGLVVYNRAIPDFQIPTSGDLVNNILDLTYHLAEGQNCLIHCAGGTGRTGMVLAAVVKNLGVYDPVARIRKVKSTYVETFDQETFLKNMPKAIDSRIVKQHPTLARAIAAEHLIQVFYTHGKAMDKAATRQDSVEQLDDNEEEKLTEAYCQTFDLIDLDKSGTLEKRELEQWFKMCGAELDLSKIMKVLLSEGSLTREKFAELMSSSAASSRREYDIGSGVSGGAFDMLYL